MVATNFFRQDNSKLICMKLGVKQCDKNVKLKSFSWNISVRTNKAILKGLLSSLILTESVLY